MIFVPEYVRELSPYKAGNQQRAVRPVINNDPINLASNGNLLGPSPKALEYMKSAYYKMNFYPDPTSSELVKLLSEKIGKRTEQIIWGHGSESLIGHVINSFSNVGDEIITASGTFVGIFVITNKLGRKINLVPLNNYAYDLEAIYNRINADTKIIYLANPNNPTGTMFFDIEFQDFILKVPENILIILDEAYYNYSRMHNGYPDGLNYNYPNLIVLRTLSKTHGLAGIRVGYAFGPEELIKIVYKVELPLEPSLAAQYAAFGALQDDEFVEQTLKVNKLSLNMIIEKIKELGIEFVSPKANFIMIILDTPEKAVQFAQNCANNGVLVRPLSAFGIPNGIRISTGTLSQTEYAINVFEYVYKHL